MPTSSRADAVPTLHSDDASRSMAWLVRVLGMREVVAHRDSGGRVVHGELAYGDTGLVIIGDRPIPSEPQRMRVQPGTASVYLVTDDDGVEATYADVLRSQDAGECEVVLELERPAYGGSTFTVRDTDGHFWTVGSYRAQV